MLERSNLKRQNDTNVHYWEIRCIYRCLEPNFALRTPDIQTELFQWKLFPQYGQRHLCELCKLVFYLVRIELLMYSTCCSYIARHNHISKLSLFAAKPFVVVCWDGSNHLLACMIIRRLQRGTVLSIFQKRQLWQIPCTDLKDINETSSARRTEHCIPGAKK